MRKCSSLFITLLFISFICPTNSWAEWGSIPGAETWDAEITRKIIRPWRATTEIVKPGDSFEVWFNADGGQTLQSVQLEGPYNTVGCSYSITTGDWEYDSNSGNRYNTRITVTVPTETPDDRYDLVLNTSTGDEVSWGGVKVIDDYHDDYYVMHISDGHIFQGGHDSEVLLARKSIMIDMANIMDVPIIIETGDIMYNIRNNPEHELAFWLGVESSNIMGMANARAATFYMPGNHDAHTGNLYSNETQEVNADWWNTYWGLQNHSFKYGNGRFMMINNDWYWRDNQHPAHDAGQWLNGNGAGGNFFLSAAHNYDKMHDIIDGYEPLDLVLSGHKHHASGDNPWQFTDSSDTIAYISASIRDYFKFNLFRVNNNTGNYDVVPGPTGVAQVLHQGNKDDRSSWVPNLSLSYANGNNGSTSENTATIVNHFDFPIMGARVRFVMPKGNTYSLTNATIKQEFEGDDFYIVDATLDVPANSNVSVDITDSTSGSLIGILQAEDADFYGSVVATNHAGYNGTGFIEYVDDSNAYIEWTVDAPEAGDYDLEFRYALPNTGRPLQLEVNGVEKIASLEFPGTGDWAIWDILSTTQTLTQGINTIRLTTIGFNGANIDELGVYQVIVPVTGVSLSPTSATLALGDTQQLTATVEPSDATNQTVSWSSSNTGVATVDSNGLVTAVADGSATITVTTEDGNKTDNCAITVSSGSTSQSGDIGSIFCWHYKEIYGGHDYNYNQSIVKGRMPTGDTHWSDNLQWWENAAEEIDYSGLDYVALLSRGNQPDAPDRGNGNPKHIPKLVNALNDRGANSVKLAIFDDIPNSWSGSKNWNESGGETYSTRDPKFDISDTANYKYIWDYNLKQAFEHIPEERLYKIDDRPVIFFWNLKDSWFINIEGNSAAVLDYIRAQCQSEFGFNPFLIVQTSWFDSDPQLSKSDVDAAHGWFSSAAGTSWTLVEENNYKVGVLVPGLREPQEPDHLDPSMGTDDNGTRLRYGLNNTVGAGAITTLVEGFTNAAEAASVWRSNDQGQHVFYDYPNQRHNIIRSYTNNPFPDTLKVEAEGCDFYDDKSLGNSGGAYRYMGNLDLLKCSDIGGGWYVTDTEADEWLEWRELPLLADTRFELRYKSTASSSVKISIDGIDLPTASLPSTNGAWSTIDIGTKSFSSNGLHTVRLTIVSGSPDINYFNRTPGVAANQLEVLQAEDANYYGAVVATNHAGYNGTGFIEYVDDSNAYIEWTVDAPEAGDYDLEFRYALPNTGRPLQLEVNGVEKIASLEFPGTGDWAIWDILSTTQTLTQGINTIRLTTIGFNGANIDELGVYQVIVPVTDVSLSPTSATLALSDTQQLTATIEPSNATNQTVSWISSNTDVATVDSNGLVTAVAGGSATITVTTEDGNKTANCAITVSSGSEIQTVQAENANYEGAVVATRHAGYNGTGFIEYVDDSNAYIEWTVDLPDAGDYALEFRYALLNSGRPLQLKVNGVEKIASFDFPATGDWAIWDILSTTQTLTQGINTIRLTTIGFNGANIDELTVAPEANYLDECEQLTGWSTSGENSLSLSSDAQQGSSSVQMTGSGTAEFYKAYSTGFNSGATVTNGVLEFWYYVSDVSLMGTNQVELGSAGQPDVDEYSWGLSGLTNGWNHIVLNISDANVIGSPDLSAINWFRFYDHKSGFVTSKIDAIQVYADLNKSANISEVEPFAIEQNGIQLYPNPAHDFVKIVSDEEIGEIGLFSISGEFQMKRVYEREKEIELDVSNLKPGLYMLVINNKTHKLIIK